MAREVEELLCLDFVSLSLPLSLLLSLLDILLPTFLTYIQRKISNRGRYQIGEQTVLLFDIKI